MTSYFKKYKVDIVPNPDMESSHSIDREGTETELEEDQDNQRSTVEEEIFTEEYEGSSFKIFEQNNTPVKS